MAIIALKFRYRRRFLYFCRKYILNKLVRKGFLFTAPYFRFSEHPSSFNINFVGALISTLVCSRVLLYLVIFEVYRLVCR